MKRLLRNLLALVLGTPRALCILGRHHYLPVAQFNYASHVRACSRCQRRQFRCMGLDGKDRWITYKP